jgi:hypothetical protein
MNTEYIDSLDEAAYISSLEQQNRELLAALQSLMPYVNGSVSFSAQVAAAQAAIAKATA